MSRYFKRLSKILVISFVVLYCLIWLLSPAIIRYVANSHGLPKHLSLTSASSIRYNPFTAHLSISDLEMQTNKQDSVLKLQTLEVELHLHQLLFDKIYVSEFNVNGVLIPVTISESTLNVAGFELMNEEPESSGTEKKIAQDANEPNDGALYEIIIPKLNLTDAKIELTHLAQTYNIQLDSFVLDDILLSKEEQDIQLNLLSQFNGAPIEVALNAQLLQQRGKVSLDLNAKDIALSSAQAFLPASISALDGNVSYASKVEVDIEKDKTLANISELILSIEDLHVEQGNIAIDLASQQIQSNDVSVLLQAKSPVSVKTVLNYVVDDISAKSVGGEALLADISKLAIENIALEFEQNIPKVNIASIKVANSQFSKNTLKNMPALASFNQLSINSIEYAPELIAVDEVTLAGLSSNVLLDEEKNLATLVALVSNETKTSHNMPKESTIDSEQVVQEPVSDEVNDAAKLVFRLGKFALVDEAVIDFKDKSVTPHYERNVSIKHLSLKNIDNSKPELETLFNMQGKSDKYASFELKGHGLAFAPQRELTLDAVIKEVSLPGVSSYIKDALQYEIESGQLDVNIAANLIGTQIDGDVDLLLRGVEFTAADDHEAGTLTDQTSVPFNIALGMLKDSDGNVELSVPLAGDTSSPSFGFTGFLTLLVKQATMSAAKDYLINTFVPYASVMKVAMAAGEYALKLRINDLDYTPEQIKLSPEQTEFSRQMSVMLEDRDEINVKLCAIAIPADIGVITAEQAHQANNVERLKMISQQRVDTFKTYMVEQLNVPSAKLLLCTPQIDTSNEAKPRIEFVI
jgi:hypothetical protein